MTGSPLQEQSCDHSDLYVRTHEADRWRLDELCVLLR